MIAVAKRARPDILNLKEYQSGRSLIKAQEGMILLDANECPYEPYEGARKYNFYADQQPDDLMNALSKLYNMPAQSIMVARGADEIIDILIRTFCVSFQDNVLSCPPTFPMYDHSALLQATECRHVPSSTDNFQIDVQEICQRGNENTKIVFLCSPNNPTGNEISTEDIEQITAYYNDKALVVVDEAYIEWSDTVSRTNLIEKYNNIVVLRTFSKAYAAAGLRVGVALAHPDVIGVLRKVLAIYPMPQNTVQDVMKILQPENISRLETKRREVIQTKKWLEKELENLDIVEKIYPSATNFLLVKFVDAKAVNDVALAAGIVLRPQSHPALENCIRFAIGSRDQMEKLLEIFKNLDRQNAPFLQVKK